MTPPTLQTETMTVSMGPQHPATHGVLRVLLTTDGEEIAAAKPVIGYLHRCAEKIGESVTYGGFIPYTDRMDYLAGMNDNWAFAMTVEKLAGVEVPERAEYVRIIVGELNRIASHLVAIGTYGLDLGTFTPFMFCFAEREKILDLFEEVSGARLLYNYVRVGGVLGEIPDGWLDRAAKFCHEFLPALERIDDLMGKNFIFIKRTAHVGVLTPQMALDYGVTGPNLRGSGVNWDLRRHAPYSIYDRFQFDIAVGEGLKGEVGDCWDRYWVRKREMDESVKIVLQAVQQIPKEGPLMGKVRKVFKPAPGEVYCRFENPRGELAFYIISDGSERAYRVKVRGPSFCNLSVIEPWVKNMLVADFAATLGSIDLVMGEVDR